MLQHFHSMETFSHFEIFNYAGRRVVEGHKVSSPLGPGLYNFPDDDYYYYCLLISQ